jgi:hypothetical protein
LRINPKFLHSNATSHKWAFGGMGRSPIGSGCRIGIWLHYYAKQPDFRDCFGFISMNKMINIIVPLSCTANCVSFKL